MIKELVVATALAAANSTVVNENSLTLYWKTHNWQNESNLSIRYHDIEVANSSYNFWQCELELSTIVEYETTPATYSIRQQFYLITRVQTKVEHADIEIERNSNFYAQVNLNNGQYKYYYIDEHLAFYNTLEGIYNLLDPSDNAQDLLDYTIEIDNAIDNDGDRYLEEQVNDYKYILDKYINAEDTDYQNTNTVFYLETATTSIKQSYTSFADAKQQLPIQYFLNVPYSTTLYTTFYINVPTGGSGEIVDIPGLLFDILGMPFAFISQAFNLTIFAGTIYEINISHVLWTIIGSLLLWIIIRKVLLK